MRHSYCAALLTLLCLHAQADSQPDPRRIKGLVGITLGNDWASINETSSVLLLNDAPAPDTFTADGMYSSKFMYGASVGIEFPIHTIGTIWQTSLAYYRAGEFTISGTEYMFGVSDLDNKTYSYNVENQRLMLENKLMFSLRDRRFYKPGFYMYLMFGLGASRNDTSNFKLTAADDTTVVVGAFESGNEKSFSYSVGFGFEAEFTSFLRLGLGYRYADLGKVTTGEFEAGDTTNTLSTNNMPTQELVFQISLM